MPSPVTIKFDMRELNNALGSLAVVSDKLPSELVNQKSYRVFQKSVWGMKAVEKETIQSELGASAAHVLVKLKSGKFSRSKKHIQQFFGEGAGQTEGLPLLAAIIQSRAGKGGKPSPFKGKTREAGIAAMKEAMQAVFNARIRSRAFFKATFATLRDIFKGSTAGNLEQAKGRIADALPARKGMAKAKAEFWLVSPKHDIKDALDKYAAPVLQAAMDEEAGETWKHEAELEYKQAIKALGIKVS
jgi:hypothetical protein